ncbi:PAS domain S-box protein [Thermaurantimonas aggregans]|uniref:PAS domain S-box protein n=1 Tax=Thermaurantimonas aggregans TaxID=2173829 RepID=UPI0023F0AE35|nr:PAS domain S-box protein [Thermaurantimonas aggregans]MCX8148118.1 PAS domain S-box protein [Thermaurantimonas aggregans]
MEEDKKQLTLEVHKLLQRQLKKAFGDELPTDDRFVRFVEAINRAYSDYEKDIKQIELVLEQSSNELFKANKELQRLAQTKAEEANQISQKLSNILANLTDVIVQLDNQGKVLYLNRAWETITGYGIEESLGVHFGDVFLGQKCHVLFEPLMHGECDDMARTIQFTRSDGKVIWVNLKMHVQRNEQGIIQGFIGIMRDETERYNVQKENEQLALVVQKTKNSIIIGDTEGKIQWVNHAFENLTGYTLSEVKGKRPGSVLQGPDTDKTTVNYIREKIQKKEVVYATLLNYSKEGKPYWIELNIEPLFDNNGEHTGYIAIQNDITERKKIQDRINQLVFFLDQSSEAVQICTEDGYLEFVNNEACKRLQRTKEELIGLHISQIEKEFEPPGAWERHVAEVKAVGKLVATGAHKRPDGSTFPVEASVSYIKSDNKGYILAFIRDISERVQAENRIKEYMANLEKVNKELDQFAYIVSHDLKAPLRAIANLATWIEEDLEGYMNPEIKKQFEMLKNRVKRMENLINGILQYSRVGRSKNKLEKIVLQDLVNELCEAIKTDNTCQFIIKNDPIELFTEKIALEQVLQNFISNAIKYNDKDIKIVEIGWSELPEDNKIEIYVRDNGPGISPEYHEKIFMIFQTLQSRDEVESTGVGLAIVKKIADEKKSKIRVESELGKGTTFYFTWPITERES